METIIILLATLYYLFCCACMESYLMEITKELTLSKAVFFTLMAFVISPIYVPILIGIKVGEMFSKV